MAAEDDGSSPTSSRHCYQLQCCVALQPISVVGGVGGKKILHRDSNVTVGRNESREILVRFSIGSGNCATYLLKDCKVHHRFAKQQGKGGIEIVSRNLMVLLSNCPPDRLNIFLKTLDAKLALLYPERQNGRLPNSKGAISLRATPVAVKDRFLSDLPRIFEKLSPLSFVEIRKLTALRDNSNIPSKTTPDRLRKSPRTKLTPKRISPGFTPKGSKRKITAARPVISATSILLSSEQKAVVRAVLDGSSLFFTGAAGTGKSLLLRKIIGLLPVDNTVVTAATGVAACQIGGVTLHSFAGVGAVSQDIGRCLQLALRPAIAAGWRRCRHLIIDEISMVDAQYFDLIEQVARHVRQNERPFGGIQVIVCGDFFQLPPVSRRDQPKRFAFKSSAWNRVIGGTMVLKQVRRQNDDQLVGMLAEIRLGRCSAATRDALINTLDNKVDREGLAAIRLCTHKEEADCINSRQLEELSGVERILTAVDSEAIPSTASVNAPLELRIKIGAVVMLTKNLDLARNLSNGSRGVVLAFDKGFPRVRFSTGEVETLKRVRFPVKLGGGAAHSLVVRNQVPLQLAWAISIHKSQGMSLDAVEMSLANVFEDGQAYVALSRVRSLAGLRLIDFDPAAVRANKEVVEFYKSLADENDDGPPLIKRQKLLKSFR